MSLRSARGRAGHAANPHIGSLVLLTILLGCGNSSPNGAVSDGGGEVDLDGGGNTVIDAGIDAGIDADIDASMPGTCIEERIPCPACMPGTFCWVYPEPHGEWVNSLSGEEDDFVWGATASNSVVEWDGDSWRLWQLPEDASLFGVSVAERSAWVASTNEAYRYHEGIWNRFERPTELAELIGVAAVNEESAWFASRLRVGKLENGTWNLLPPLPDPASTYITEVFGAGPDSLFVRVTAGRRIVYHYDGSSWAEVTPPFASSPNYFVVGSAGAAHVWVVEAAELGENGVKAIYKWNGQAWDSLETPVGVESRLASVAGTSTGEFIISFMEGQLRHWDGASYNSLWSRDAEAPWASIYGMAITGADTAWAAGSSGFLLRGDSSGWQSVGGEVVRSGDATMFQPGELWIPGALQFYRYDSSGGQVVPIGTGFPGVHPVVRNAGSLWRLVSGQGLWRYDGDSWGQAVPDLTGAPIIGGATGIRGFGQDEVWAISGGLFEPKLEKYEAGEWTEIIDLAPASFALFGTEPDSMLVVAQGSQALTHLSLFNGVGLTELSLPAAVPLGRIYGAGELNDGSAVMLIEDRDGPSPHDHYIVTWDGTALATIPHPEPNSADVRSIGGTSLDNFWLASSRQDIPQTGLPISAYHWDGATWTEQKTRYRGQIMSDGLHVYQTPGSGLLQLVE